MGDSLRRPRINSRPGGPVLPEVIVKAECDRGYGNSEHTFELRHFAER